MKKCAYCNKEGKLTKEHIWPKCIINRMPELEAKFIGGINKFTSSELVISDVCAECNNVKLSKLDSYLCQLYDSYFKNYKEDITSISFNYDYELLLRSLLKITYNSSRTIYKEENDFKVFRNFILEGGMKYENIVIKLEIILPARINETLIYPKSARCGRFDVGIQSDKFILRLISINSFYFYIVISKDEFIQDQSLGDFQEIFSRTPGEIVHPYRNHIIIENFSNNNAYLAHIDFVQISEKYFKNYMSKKFNK